MLMVILGAGASYDSSQAYRPVHVGWGGQQSSFGVPAQRPDDEGPWRPPLAKDLFLDRHHALGNIVRKYPKLSHILPYLREPSNNRSVEEILESLQEEGKDNPESQREFASVRYYLSELLHEVTEGWLTKTNRVTNYAPLLRDILRFNRSSEPVCLVTFNYDLLLERALDNLGVLYFDGFLGTINRTLRTESYHYDLYYPGETTEGRVSRWIAYCTCTNFTVVSTGVAALRSLTMWSSAIPPQRKTDMET